MLIVLVASQAAGTAAAWGQNATRCADVSGGVENLGRALPDNPPTVKVRNPRLSYVFFPDLDPEVHAKVQALLISPKEDGELDVAAISGARGVLERKTFIERRGDYSCQNGRVVIKRTIDMRSEGARFYSNTEFRLFGTPAGPLVLERQNVIHELGGPKETLSRFSFQRIAN
jgi:hypothetical protein